MTWIIAIIVISITFALIRLTPGAIRTAFSRGQLAEEPVATRLHHESFAKVIPLNVPEEIAQAKYDFGSRGGIATTHYSGKVELEITPSVDFVRLRRLGKYLQALPKVQMMGTVGSSVGSTAIIVSLGEPMPLVDILKQMPEVEDVAEDGQLEEIDRLGQSLHDSCKRRIRVSLKTDNL